METQHIFIDTSVFRNKSFDLTNDSIKILRNLIKEKDVFIYTTSITNRECEKHLILLLDEQKSVLNKLNIHLRNINSNELDFIEIRKNRIKNWKTFIAEFNEIPIYTESVESVFDSYFDFRPPFESKTKKSEFPDAFVLETLRHWCEETGNKLYAISSDKPFSNYENSQIICLDSLEEFLDIVSQYKSSKNIEEKLYEFAESSFEYLKEVIIKEITEDFEGSYFNAPDLWDSYIEDVEVDQVQIHKPYFIDINEDYCILEVDIDIYFTASLFYGNPDRIYRDPDTRDFVILERIKDSIAEGITTTATIEIHLLLGKDGNDSHLISVSLPNEFEKEITSKKFEHFRLLVRSH